MKKYDKLDYVAFEHIFARYCKRDIHVNREINSIVPPTAENIDRFVLLPAAMSDTEIASILWSDDCEKVFMDKATLSRFRTTGKLQEQIVRCYQKENASDLVANYFDAMIFDAMVIDPERITLFADDIKDVIDKDKTIPSKYRKEFLEYYRKDVPRFMASTLIFSIIRYEENLFEETTFDPIMQQVLDDLASCGSSRYLDRLLEDILDDIKYESKADNETPPFTRFSYDMCSQFIIKLAEYKKILPKAARGATADVAFLLVGYDMKILERKGLKCDVSTLFSKYGLDYGTSLEVPNGTEYVSKIVQLDEEWIRMVYDINDPETKLKLIGVDKETLQPLKGESRIESCKILRAKDSF